MQTTRSNTFIYIVLIMIWKPNGLNIFLRYDVFQLYVSFVTFCLWVFVIIFVTNVLRSKVLIWTLLNYLQVFVKRLPLRAFLKRSSLRIFLKLPLLQIFLKQLLHRQQSGLDVSLLNSVYKRFGRVSVWSLSIRSETKSSVKKILRFELISLS